MRAISGLSPGRLESLRDDGAQGDEHQEEREGQQQVGEAADEGVEPATLVGGDDADGRADDGDEHDRGDRDEQRDAGAVDEAGEQVAAGERLHAERVLPGGAAPRALRAGCPVAGSTAVASNT